MDFHSALRLIERNKDLIGTITEKGLLIDMLLVVPTATEQQEEFFRSLMLTRNPQQSILPYINCDVEVWASNTEYLYKQNVLFYKIVRD